MNKYIIEVITSVPQKILPPTDKHLTSVIIINNIMDMTIYKSSTWENIFPHTWGSCPVEQRNLVYEKKFFIFFWDPVELIPPYRWQVCSLYFDS